MVLAQIVGNQPVFVIGVIEKPGHEVTGHLFLARFARIQRERDCLDAEQIVMVMLVRFATGVAGYAAS